MNKKQGILAALRGESIRECKCGKILEGIEIILNDGRRKTQFECGYCIALAEFRPTPTTSTHGNFQVIQNMQTTTGTWN